MQSDHISMLLSAIKRGRVLAENWKENDYLVLFYASIIRRKSRTRY